LLAHPSIVLCISACRGLTLEVLLTLWALELIRRNVNLSLDMTVSQLFFIQLEYFLLKAILFFTNLAVQGYLAAEWDGRPSFFDK
jgi:hypothetical protein